MIVSTNQENEPRIIESSLPNACMISVVIPAKNEEGRIAKSLLKLHKALSLLGFSYEIVVVNDGSNDKTANVAKLFGAQVINHKFNKGIAAAFRSGARHSNGNVVMLCPADIEDFAFLKEAMSASGKFEVVSISKRHAESVVVGYSSWRWLLSNGYQRLVNLLFATSRYCTDTHYIKLYNGPILRKIIDKCSINGPVGETELMVCAKDAGCSFFEMPAKILHNTNHSKTSKKIIIRTIQELVTLRIRRSKLYTLNLTPTISMNAFALKKNVLEKRVRGLHRPMSYTKS